MFSPKERLSQALGPDTTETCNTYNMLKLTRHLFEWDPRAAYADYYERALYNHILASQDPESGMMCYYVPLRPGSQEGLQRPTTSFWCCTGTGVENHAKYGDSIYFRSTDGKTLYVNLFIPSELSWKAGRSKLRQETTFPAEQGTRLVFSTDPRRARGEDPASFLGEERFRDQGQRWGRADVEPARQTTPLSGAPGSRAMSSRYRSIFAPLHRGLPR